MWIDNHVENKKSTAVAEALAVIAPALFTMA